MLNKIKDLAGKHKNKLWGFQTEVPYKKLLAFLYYFFCLLLLIAAVVTPPFIPAGVYDTLIWKISLLILVVWTLTPAIFLSKTKLRDRLPFLKNYNLMSSLVGMGFIFIAFTYLFGMVLSWHSAEYKAAFEQFVLSLG